MNTIREHEQRIQFLFECLIAWNWMTSILTFVVCIAFPMRKKYQHRTHTETHSNRQGAGRVRDETPVDIEIEYIRQFDVSLLTVAMWSTHSGENVERESANMCATNPHRI